MLEAELTHASPTEDEVRAHWQANPARFRSPPLRQASHILFAAEPGDMAALATARARALAAQAELASNPAHFAALASQISDCPSKASGGALGQLRPGDMVPEFEAALDGLTAGQIAPDPVQTRFGLHLVRLDELAEGRELPFDAVRPHLTEAMEKQAWAVAARDYALRLAAKAQIEGVDLGVAA